MEAFRKIIRIGVTPIKERHYSVYVTAEYDGRRLALRGVEGPMLNGDCKGECGQLVLKKWNIARYAKGMNAEVVERIREIWKRWHLNDMQEGSPRQMEWLRQHAGIPRGYDEVRQALTDAGLNPDTQHDGYVYGSRWLAEDVPESILEEVRAWPDADIPLVRSWMGGAMKTGCITYRDGTREWWVDYKRHRTDGPAVERADGTREWWVDGKRHRLDGPAVEWPDGSREWLIDGKRHRTDGPAVERSDGTRMWWVEGQRHRLDGPAVEWPDGSREWLIDDKIHRLDGPAVEWDDGTREWWVDGKRHRTDGPAVEWDDGTREWWVDGKRHRIDGPAVEWPDGTRMWWVDGKRHRLDGPAVEWDDGTREWWVDGNREIYCCLEWINVNDRVLYEDAKRRYCLRITPEGRVRAGCRDYSMSEALAHWGPDSPSSQPAYFDALIKFNKK